MIHDFKTSLAIGKVGEEVLAKLMPELKPLNGRKADFIHEQTGEKWELKTDSYDYTKTKNIFLEVYSDSAKKTVGGPRQAMQHGSKYWLYMFSKNKILLIFETAKLVDWLDANQSKYALIPIQNKGWTTLGFKLPREHVKHLYTVRHFDEQVNTGN